ncbi:hypothetical protein C8F01DRAFT_1092933 [Mycena amicta]|nr:hypothetical protein C8F01DRAFT_1092933 [Mycena amicta]
MTPVGTDTGTDTGTDGKTSVYPQPAETDPIDYERPPLHPDPRRLHDLRIRTDSATGNPTGVPTSGGNKASGSPTGSASMPSGSSGAGAIIYGWCLVWRGRGCCLGGGVGAGGRPRLIKGARKKKRKEKEKEKEETAQQTNQPPDSNGIPLRSLPRACPEHGFREWMQMPPAGYIEGGGGDKKDTPIYNQLPASNGMPLRMVCDARVCYEVRERMHGPPAGYIDVVG